MNGLRSIRDHVLYLFTASTSFPFALEKPAVYFGNFNELQSRSGHEDLYSYMRNNGWRREIFQLVLPGQTAGLVKTVNLGGFDEAHVRFYDDGVVSCELEANRFGLGHWRNKRIYGHFFSYGFN